MTASQARPRQGRTGALSSVESWCLEKDCQGMSYVSFHSQLSPLPLLPTLAQSLPGLWRLCSMFVGIEPPN